MPYQRPPLTKELLRGEMDEGELPIEAETWLREQRVRLARRRAVTLDPGARTDRALRRARRSPTRTACMATGAEPTRLPVPGADDPAVRVLRTFADLRELTPAWRRRARSWRSIGSGLHRLRDRRVAADRGHAVTMISDERAPNAGASAPTPPRGSPGGSPRTGSSFTRRAGRGIEPRTALSPSPRAGRRSAQRHGRHGRRRRAARRARRRRGDCDRRGRCPGRRGDAHGRPTACSPRVMCAVRYNVAAGRSAARRALGRRTRPGRGRRSHRSGRRGVWDEVPGFWSTIGRARSSTRPGATASTRPGSRTTARAPSRPGTGATARSSACSPTRRDEDYERGPELIAQGAPWRY